MARLRALLMAMALAACVAASPRAWGARVTTPPLAPGGASSLHTLVAWFRCRECGRTPLTQLRRAPPRAGSAAAPDGPGGGSWAAAEDPMGGWLGSVTPPEALVAQLQLRAIPSADAARRQRRALAEAESESAALAGSGAAGGAVSDEAGTLQGQARRLSGFGGGPKPSPPPPSPPLPPFPPLPACPCDRLLYLFYDTSGARCCWVTESSMRVWACRHGLAWPAAGGRHAVAGLHG